MFKLVIPFFLIITMIGGGALYFMKYQKDDIQLNHIDGEGIEKDSIAPLVSKEEILKNFNGAEEVEIKEKIGKIEEASGSRTTSITQFEGWDEDSIPDWKKNIDKNSTDKTKE